LPLIRTPAGKPLTAFITSDDLIGCDTHFWGGHTVPCDKPDCEACEAGSTYRWHAYLAAYNPDDQLHFIFECTAQAAAKFQEYRKEHVTLRGCHFQAYRWHGRRNGRVIIKFSPASLVPAALPNAPDLAKVMAVVWRLPLPNVFVAGVERGAARIHADPAGNGDSADPKDYSHGRP